MDKEAKEMRDRASEVARKSLTPPPKDVSGRVDQVIISVGVDGEFGSGRSWLGVMLKCPRGNTLWDIQVRAKDDLFEQLVERVFQRE